MSHPLGPAEKWWFKPRLSIRMEQTVETTGAISTKVSGRCLETLMKMEFLKEIIQLILHDGNVDGFPLG